MNKTYRILGQKGRITIPLELRCDNDMCCGDMLSFEQTDDGILIRNVSAEERYSDDSDELDIDELSDKSKDRTQLFNALDELSLSDRWTALTYLTMLCSDRR